MKKHKLPGPCAHHKEKWDETFKIAEDAKEYVTNGHFILKTDKVPKRVKPQNDKAITLNRIKTILDKSVKPAQLKYYAFNDPDTGQGVSLEPIGLKPNNWTPNKVIFESRQWVNGNRSGVWLEVVDWLEFDQGYFNIFRNRYPGAKYGLNSETHQLTAFDNGEAVGVIMAIRSDETPTCYDIARKMGYIL